MTNSWSMCFCDIGLMADAKHQCVSICFEIELSILDRFLFIFIFIVYIYFFVLINLKVVIATGLTSYHSEQRS